MARSPEKIAGLSRFLGGSHQGHGPSRGGGRRQRCCVQCRKWSRDPKVMHGPRYTFRRLLNPLISALTGLFC